MPNDDADLRASEASARSSDDLTSYGHPNDERGPLEGWEPAVGVEVSLEQVVERAFDYRGDVTVVRQDGSEVIGYLFNRNAEVARRFVQMFDRAGEGPLTIPYAEIRTIRFTGKDTAAGRSYEAWLRRKTERPTATAASDSATGGS
jgi:hypothetical protein